MRPYPAGFEPTDSGVVATTQKIAQLGQQPAPLLDDLLLRSPNLPTTDGPDPYCWAEDAAPLAVTNDDDSAISEIDACDQEAGASLVITRPDGSELVAATAEGTLAIRFGYDAPLGVYRASVRSGGRAETESLEFDRPSPVAVRVVGLSHTPDNSGCGEQSRLASKSFEVAIEAPSGEDGQYVLANYVDDGDWVNIFCGAPIDSYPPLRLAEVSAPLDLAAGSIHSEKITFPSGPAGCVVALLAEQVRPAVVDGCPYSGYRYWNPRHGELLGLPTARPLADSVYLDERLTVRTSGLIPAERYRLLLYEAPRIDDCVVEALADPTVSYSGLEGTCPIASTAGDLIAPLGIFSSSNGRDSAPLALPPLVQMSPALVDRDIQDFGDDACLAVVAADEPVAAQAFCQPRFSLLNPRSPLHESHFSGARVRDAGNASPEIDELRFEVASSDGGTWVLDAYLIETGVWASLGGELATSGLWSGVVDHLEPVSVAVVTDLERGEYCFVARPASSSPSYRHRCWTDDAVAWVPG